jgi:hypothetical protein
MNANPIRVAHSSGNLAPFRPSLCAFSALALLHIFACSPLGAATIVDLTSAGSSGVIGGAIYEQSPMQSTGTGTINTFVQVQAQGNNTTQHGYNTTVNNTLDNGNSDNFNHAITLGEVPIVTKAGVNYREFFLDVNEADQGPAMGRYISLDEVQIFVGGTPNSNVTTFTAGVLDHDGTLVYRMDDGMDNWVALDFQLNSGSGSGDMHLYVPNALFSGFANTDTVVLYSAFGFQGVNPPNGLGGNFVGDFGASSGFEEWAVRNVVPTSVPEPGTIATLALGMIALGGHRARRR